MCSISFSADDIVASESSIIHIILFLFLSIAGSLGLKIDRNPPGGACITQINTTDSIYPQISHPRYAANELGTDNKQ